MWAPKGTEQRLCRALYQRRRKYKNRCRVRSLYKTQDVNGLFVTTANNIYRNVQLSSKFHGQDFNEVFVRAIYIC